MEFFIDADIHGMIKNRIHKDFYSSRFDNHAAYEYTELRH
jgi:hypothetical protein